MPVWLYCSPAAVPTVPPAPHRGAPKSPAINMQSLANTLKHSKTTEKKILFKKAVENGK